MIDFVLASENLLFMLSLGLMIAIGLLEGITTLLGFGASGFIDSLIPDVDMDVDLDLDIDADVDLDVDLDGSDLSEMGSAGALSRLWGWINVGRVPLLVLFILFLFSFGMMGLIVQSFAQKFMGSLIPGIGAAALVFFPCIYIVRFFSKLLSHIIPKDETDAVSESSFVGRVAVITTGMAKKGKPAQAKLKDQYGMTHYIMVEPDNGADVFESGSDVLLVMQAGALFYGIRNPSPSLVEKNVVR